VNIKKPLKQSYFNYKDIESWLIELHPYHKNHIKEDLRNLIDDIFGIIDSYSEEGLMTIDLDILEDGLLSKDWAKEIIEDLKELNNNNSDILLYINSN